MYFAFLVKVLLCFDMTKMLLIVSTLQADKKIIFAAICEGELTNYSNLSSSDTYSYVIYL